VLFSAFAKAKPGVAGAAGATGTDQTVKSIDPEEGAMMLGYARSVVIIPGYGMAVAQAQHAVRELADQLERLGVDVKYAIHPVAGRMPGHMNVLLAEANVPYPQLYDMDDINPEFDRTDVALVIGANDVVNPAARHDTNSPIYGMPILEVDKAMHTIVIKRGMSKGFAGIENELFYKDKTMMMFGGARDVVAQLVSQVKQL
jgi:H+-translocating NAD(P) transhydrogenase subunit beta